jgi:hypothetical protein
MLDYFGNQLDPAKYIFRTYKYFGDFALTALQVLPGQSITLKGQEAFFAIMRCMAVSTGAFRVSLYTSNSERYQSGSLSATTDRVRSEAMYGTASRPAVLPVPIVIPGSSNIVHDLEDVSNGNNSLHLVYEGVRLYPR